MRSCCVFCSQSPKRLCGVGTNFYNRRISTSWCRASFCRRTLPRATYDRSRPFLPWVIAIARNRMADSARRYARRAAYEVASEQPPEAFPGGEANMSGTAYGDTHALARAMSNLPPRQRRAVELTKLREMSLKEASAATGTSFGALMVSVHGGVSALRKALASTN